jgi:general stress protein 26
MTNETLSDSAQGFLVEAIAIAHENVWGAMTTVSPGGRPRSRIVHPVWVFDGTSVVGWLTTRPTPVKVAHLRSNPFVSVAYIGATSDFVYFDCEATWVDDLTGKRQCWDAFLAAPEPVRYDPGTIWKEGPNSPDFAVLRFRPYRIQAARAERIARGEKPHLVRLAP